MRHGNDRIADGQALDRFAFAMTCPAASRPSCWVAAAGHAREFGTVPETRCGTGCPSVTRRRPLPRQRRLLVRMRPVVVAVTEDLRTSVLEHPYCRCLRRSDASWCASLPSSTCAAANHLVSTTTQPTAVPAVTRAGTLSFAKQARLCFTPRQACAHASASPPRDLHLHRPPSSKATRLSAHAVPVHSARHRCAYTARRAVPLQSPSLPLLTARPAYLNPPASALVLYTPHHPTI